MAVLISDHQETISIDESFFRDCQKIVNLAWAHIFNKEADVSIVFVDNETISKLNKYYRGKEGPTDVLSFPLVDQSFNEDLIGEIVVSLPRAQEQAQEYGNSLFDEVRFLLVHGLLHLAGYDHDNEHTGEMRRKEKEIMSILHTL